MTMRVAVLRLCATIFSLFFSLMFSICVLKLLREPEEAMT